MTPNEYLKAVLAEQTLPEDGPQLTALKTERERVEKVLREAFGSKPTIRYGGSRAKGTMIRESYDLDIICYWPHDDLSAGDSLADLFEVTQSVLAKHYCLERKNAAIRLQSSNRSDLRVDVVPGRFVDASQSDAYLYQSNGEKRRLKTNLETHIKFIQESGLVQEIRLMKLWKARNGLPNVKTFALDLLVIKMLNGQTCEGLNGRIERLWQRLRDERDSLRVVDPANSNNDLSGLLDVTARASLAFVAAHSLSLVQTAGWEQVFGPLRSR